MSTPLDRARGCLLGLAIGDAIGTTVEFERRGTFPPVTDMTGGGPFHLQPGQWTDDTSMALCLATSLLESGGFDAHDQMERYVRWYRDGYLSSTGACFDIGNTVRGALEAFEATGDPFSGPTHERSAGNGSIMRLAPIPIFFSPDLEATVRWSAESSRTTHGALECVDACRCFGAMLHSALRGDAKEQILFGDHLAGLGGEPLAPQIAEIAAGAYREKSEAEIRGSGYVVESLEAALWCFHRSESFAEAVLRAANLGDDADTTAAVCGQIAGAYWGVGGMPKWWVEGVVMRDEMRGVVGDLRAPSS